MLIDEISLANDSVLERLNSVFEADRTLRVTEKSSQNEEVVVAHEKFNMVSTMNPSGDFGKKELSPALRNRMTEIWVDSNFNQEKYKSKAAELLATPGKVLMHDEVDTQIDLFLIISELCRQA